VILLFKRISHEIRIDFTASSIGITVLKYKIKAMTGIIADKKNAAIAFAVEKNAFSCLPNRMKKKPTDADIEINISTFVRKISPNSSPAEIRWYLLLFTMNL
jgi:hypothetical protein